jgi:inositol transport system substrate-binding protein
MKKILLSGVALLMASTFAIAAPVKVGVSIANFDDTFLTYMMDGMKAYAKAHSSEIDITFTDAKEDMAKQLDQVENFLVQKKDAIIIVPVDTSATGPMTSSIVSKGAKVVYVNRNPGNLQKGAYYVGSEELVAGRLQMEFIGEKLGGKGNIAILMGKLDNEGALKRTAGNEEVLKKKFPNIKVLDKQTGLWQRSEGMQKTEDWVNRFGKDINAILCNNDDMALGAIQALKDKKRTDILVIGVDATPDALTSLSKGELAATVFQDAAGQGGGAVEVALKAVKGEKVSTETWIPFKLVTPANLKQFKK